MEEDKETLTELRGQGVTCVPSLQKQVGSACCVSTYPHRPPESTHCLHHCAPMIHITLKPCSKTCANALGSSFNRSSDDARICITLVSQSPNPAAGTPNTVLKVT
ncbi:hypothetical protein ACLOJK_033062 [Asimina triloba]